MPAGAKLASVRVQVLGEPVLYCAGEQVTPPERIFSLLALLALADGHAIRRTMIAQLFWDEVHADRANGNLRQFVARLRRFQDSVDAALIAIDDGTFRLSAGVDVDAVHFRVASVERMLQDRDGKKLKRLCWLYRGDLLVGINSGSAAFEEWLASTRRDLRDRLMDAAAAALEIPHFFASPDDQLSVARRIFQLDPTHEPACRLIMEIDAARGGRASALRCFARCEAALVREFGVEPERRTIDIARRIQCTRPVER